MIPKIFEPSEELSSIVKNYWVLQSPKNKTPNRNTIVPDGSMKMIFHYGDRYKHHPKNTQSYFLPRSFVIGQLTQPYEVEPTGDTGIFFVCFMPNGFLPFSPLPIKEMQNIAVSLDELFGVEGQKLEQKILNAQTDSQRIQIVEDFLFSQLASKKCIEKTIESAVKTILNTDEKLSIDTIGQQLDINKRKLERQFASAVGLSPKQLLKIIRLQNSLKMMLENNTSKLTDIAYENEYFDQSHFNKDFKEFTGLSPKKFYGNDLKMSLIFETID